MLANALEDNFGLYYDDRGRRQLASALAPGLGERVLREAPVPVLLLRD